MDLSCLFGYYVQINLNFFELFKWETVGLEEYLNYEDGHADLNVEVVVLITSLADKYVDEKIVESEVDNADLFEFDIEIGVLILLEYFEDD